MRDNVVTQSIIITDDYSAMSFKREVTCALILIERGTFVIT